MEYSLWSTREIRLYALQFPFPLRWRIERGVHQLSPLVGTVRTDHEGALRLSAEQPFDVSMMPDASGAASGRLVLDTPSRSRLEGPDWDSLDTALWHSNKCLGLVLAQNMFCFPDDTWSLREVAHRLGTDPRHIQVALFRECYSFAATLQRCRRLNLLLSKESLQGSAVLCGR
jgi:hypothetical protein